MRLVNSHSKAPFGNLCTEKYFLNMNKMRSTIRKVEISLKPFYEKMKKKIVLFVVNFFI
jgi:hypothetical protein